MNPPTPDRCGRASGDRRDRRDRLDRLDRRDRRDRLDRGSAVLETVALIPLILLVGTMALQLGVAVWTTAATDTAARQAARAATLGSDPLTTANDSLPGRLTVAPGDITTSRGIDDFRVTLRVDVPRVSILPVFTVQRDAVMPDIQP